MKSIVKSAFFVLSMIALATACQSNKSESTGTETTTTTDTTATMSTDTTMAADTTMATDTTAR